VVPVGAAGRPQRRLDARDVGGHVDGDARPAPDLGDADAVAVLEGAQLLELLGLLGGGARPFHELEQEVPAVDVEADVLERRDPRVLASIGDRGAGEVEGKAVAVGDFIRES